MVICEAFVEGNIRKALGHMTKRKSNVAQDFRSAKVQNLAQTMVALSVATLTFSTSYTQSHLAAKLQVEYFGRKRIRAYLPPPPRTNGGPMCALRLLIADDHEIVRCGLRALLKSHPEWEVCAEAVDGQEAVDMARQLKPDIVILDMGMPNMNGLIAARQIRQTQPNQKILVLSVTDEEQLVQEVLAVGARGFVLKSDAARDLIAAVEALQAGTTFFTSHIEERVLRGYLNKRQDDADGVPHLSSLSSLTLREREIVQLVAEGKCTKEVAVLLNLREKAAETHRSTIMRKLGLHTISELVLYAVQNHIIQVKGGSK